MKFRLFPEGIPVEKRLMDLIITIPGIILISPLLGIVAISVWLIHGWPVLFQQKRPGYRGEIFTINKFRTMRDLKDEQGNPLPDEARLTKWGDFLRASSLDELPELFNVLRGEMSLVGPRPLLVRYLERYNAEQARRHDVFPGITGWAQINGRNILVGADKFILDVWYVDNWSLWLDIKILALTVWKVITREGISTPGEATFIEFMGNDEEQQTNQQQPDSST